MLRLLRRFWRAKDGLAAVEFGMIAPILAAMFLGSVEVCSALDCQQKVAGMASTAADLVAQETTVSDSDLGNVYSAVNSIVYPFNTNTVKIVITSLTDNGNGGGTVAWSAASGPGATARTAGATVVVPTGVISTGGSVILAEITYPYSSKVADYITGQVNMTQIFYARPRRSTKVLKV